MFSHYTAQRTAQLSSFAKRIPQHIFFQVLYGINGLAAGYAAAYLAYPVAPPLWGDNVVAQVDALVSSTRKLHELRFLTCDFVTWDDQLYSLSNPPLHMEQLHLPKWQLIKRVPKWIADLRCSVASPYVLSTCRLTRFMLLESCHPSSGSVSRCCALLKTVLLL